jgi:hypothetical protein
MKRVQATLESIPVARPEPTPDAPQGMCLDKGYDYDEVRDLVKEFLYTAPIRARGRGGAGHQARGRLQGPPLGGGADAQLDEPLPPDPDAAGEGV